MQSARVACVTALLAALAWTIRPATSLATCSQGPLGFAVWPKSEATDLPVDTPIVVARYFVDGDTDVIQTSLTAEDGTGVPLQERSRLPPPWRGCGSGEYLFLRPTSKLTAGEKYTLTITSGAKGPVTRSAFTVGNEVTVAEADVQPEITYLEVFPRPECVHEECEGFAKLLVDLKAPPSRPLWLRVHGSHPQQDTNAWTFYPEGWNAQQEALAETQLSVPLTIGDRCIDIQIYGIEGRALFAQRHCQPDRCAVYGITAARNSGGGPGGSPVDVESVPPDNCDKPPVLKDSPSGIVYPDTQAKQPDPDAGSAESYADDASVPRHRDAAAGGPSSGSQRASGAPAANGCSISQAGVASTPATSLPTMFCLAVLAVARRRLGRTSLSLGG